MVSLLRGKYNKLIIKIILELTIVISNALKRKSFENVKHNFEMIRVRLNSGTRTTFCILPFRV